MKKALRAAVAAIALSAAVAFAGCKVSPYSTFKRATGVAVPECGGVTTIDTTGWNGDGELVYHFYLDEENGQKFENTVASAEHWQSLPMTATLDELVYEHFDGVIPRVESGYYFFYDEQRKAHEAAENIIEISSSFDFVIGMYDTESRTVYYYEQHT